MKLVTPPQVWLAFDGIPFSTDKPNAEAECRAYERRLAHLRLVGLTIEQVEAALSRADAELADAIEVIGSRIARARLDAGEKKHERKAIAKPGDAPPDPTPPNDSASSETTMRQSSESDGGFVQSKGDALEEAAAA